MDSLPSVTRSFVFSPNEGRGFFKVNALLRKIGNQEPYFSVTLDSRDMGGCCHDIIEKHWPEIKPIIDLHLSDIDGKPIHYEANGFYWLAGCFDSGLGETYHGGSGKDGKTKEECFRIFCDYLRLTDAAAKEIIQSIKAVPTRQAQKAIFKNFCEDQLPRWKAEAQAGIELLNKLSA